MTSIDPRRSVRRAVSAAVLCLAMISISGCGGDDAGTDAVSTTVGPATEADFACESHMPGEPLDATEAVVGFSTEQICPAYVTVVSGTPVTWHNRSDEARTVRIVEGPTEDGEVVEEIELGPDEMAERTFDEPGYLTFTTDALPDARGTVEIQQDPGESPLDAD